MTVTVLALWTQWPAHSLSQGIFPTAPTAMLRCVHRDTAREWKKTGHLVPQKAGLYLGRMILQDLTGSIPNQTAAAVYDQRGPVTITQDSLMLATNKQRTDVLEGEPHHHAWGRS